jgi:hypothetical protein
MTGDIHHLVHVWLRGLHVRGVTITPKTLKITLRNNARAYNADFIRGVHGISFRTYVSQKGKDEPVLRDVFFSVESVEDQRRLENGDVLVVYRVRWTDIQSPEAEIEFRPAEVKLRISGEISQIFGPVCTLRHPKRK